MPENARLPRAAVAQEMDPIDAVFGALIAAGWAAILFRHGVTWGGASAFSAFLAAMCFLAGWVIPMVVAGAIAIAAFAVYVRREA